MTEKQAVDDGRKISPANITDLQELTQLMDKANEYTLSKSGEKLWGLKELALRELASHLKAGDCYVMRDNQKIAATITITESDRLWDTTGTDGMALYIHKLMKDPACRISNIGLAFLSFALQEALRRNKKFLRCDTITTQERLINYYRKLGFIEKDLFTYVPSGRPGVFLEADVQEVLKKLSAIEKL